MPVKLSPAIKGLITAAVMIAASLYIDSRKDSINPGIQYIVYAFYAAGIIWTLVSFARTSSSPAGFAGLFSQGFKCFIIVTLMMVAFTIVFVKTHPEYAEQESTATREYYIKEGDKTAPEIDDLAKKAKKQYPVTVISISIFRYLIIGGAITAASSAVLRRK